MTARRSTFDDLTFDADQDRFILSGERVVDIFAANKYWDKKIGTEAVRFDVFVGGRIFSCCRVQLSCTLKGRFDNWLIAHTNEDLVLALMPGKTRMRFNAKSNQLAKNAAPKKKATKRRARAGQRE